jgi:hypothetical protein
MRAPTPTFLPARFLIQHIEHHAIVVSVVRRSAAVPPCLLEVVASCEAATTTAFARAHLDVVGPFVAVETGDRLRTDGVLEDNRLM